MSQFRYRQLADQLIRQLQQGYYPTGERLPSVRQLSLEQGVSKGTVIRCYEYLEDNGWVEAREKSGFYPGPKGLRVPAGNLSQEHIRKSPSPAQLAALAPRHLDEKALSLEVVRAARISDQVPLGTAHPCVSFPAVRRLYQLLKQEVRREECMLDNGLLSYYETPPGAEALRYELSRYLNRRQLPTHPDRIIITNGAQSAVSLALQATSGEGDIVLIESPCFYGILQCLQAFRRKVVEIPQCESGGPDLELLEAALAKWPVRTLIVQPTLNNPTGRTMPLANRQRLIELANRYDVAVIEDDIFADLDYRGQAPSPLKALDRENRVLYCSSISKILTPKLRLGWLIAGRWHQRCQHLQFVSKMGLPGHTQNALSNWLAQGFLNRHLRLVRRRYQQRQRLFHQALRDYWPDTVHYQPAEGSFLAWLQLPEGCDGMQLYQAARREKISITPGVLFGSSEDNKRCIRINFALFQDRDDYLQAMQQLGRMVQTMSSGLAIGPG